jgi:hypothetical protein
MNPPYSGGCLCGAVRYRVIAEPETFYVCHCTDCQRRNGSAFGLSFVVRREAVESSGDTHLHVAKLADGRIKQSHACVKCNTRLWGESVRNPAFFILQPGTLDDTSWLQPVAHIWTRSAQPWFPFPPDAVKFETQPPEAWKVLFKLWRER